MTNISLTTQGASERRRPPRNALALDGGARAWLMRHIQLFVDLQVSTASRHAKSWLRTRRGDLLEVGCGDRPYARYIPKACRYLAIDRRAISDDFDMSRHPDVVYYDGPVFPVASARFESLFHTEVLEHVYETRLFLAECHRVLRPDGEMFFTVPFQARYHFKPHDYFRFTPAALERMLSDVGFAEVGIRPRGNDITVACYKVAAVGFRWAYGGIAGKLMFLATAPLTMAALVIAHGACALNLGSEDDCLGYSVTARKASDAASSG